MKCTPRRRLVAFWNRGDTAHAHGLEKGIGHPITGDARRVASCSWPRPSRLAEPKTRTTPRNITGRPAKLHLRVALTMFTIRKVWNSVRSLPVGCAKS